MIRVKYLSFSYSDGTPALKGINFSVEGGCCLAILGSNGSGKTTLLYCLAGVIPHVISGEIFGSVDIGCKPLSSIFGGVYKDISLVQQDPESQIVSTTVEAECAFAPSNFGLNKEEIRHRIKYALDIVGLTGYEKRLTQNLSYGEKQRLNIAAVLTQKPNILVFDEPFSNVDAMSRRQILLVFNKLKTDLKVNLIISTHDISKILDIVDHVLLLSKAGEQLAFGPPREILENRDLLCEAGVNLPPMLNISTKLELSKPSYRAEEICTSLNCHQSKNISTLFESVLKNEFEKQLQEQPKEPIDKEIIELTDVCFAFPGGKQVLENINLNIYEGESIGIIGTNGSGKTTLVKHIVGLLRPTKGRLSFRGQDIDRFSIGQLSTEIGMVLQNPDHQLVYAESVFDEIAYGLRIINATEEDIDSTVCETLKIIELEAKREIYPGKLSFGEKKKLLIACMIARRPHMLILDEPFFGLDYIGKSGLVDILNNLCQRMQTIIVVTHDIDTIAKFATRLIVLNRGRVVLDGSTLDVLTDPLFVKCALEPPEVIVLAECFKNKGISFDFRI